MTLQIGFLLGLLLVMVYLFLTEKLPVDLTAFLGLAILTLAGFLRPEEAFTGFASSAVITMLSIFIVSAALLNTGVADAIGGRVHAWIGNREVPLIVAIMLVAGALSAFMNNIAATAVLMPAVSSISRRTRLPPSRLFMPLAFGAILGGTTTLVGTPPNILAAAMLEERGFEPFGLFDFFPLGATILIVGILYMVTIGRKLLPKAEATQQVEASDDLAQVYQLRDRLFSLRIAKDSALDGSTLGETRLGTALGVQVIAILRGGKRHLAPEAGSRLQGGDVLFVEGDKEALNELLRVQSVEVERTDVGKIPQPASGVGGIRLRVAPGSTVIGKSLRDLHFRDRYGVVVIGVRHGGEMQRENLGGHVFEEGDTLFGLGPRKKLAKLREMSDFELREVGFSALRELETRLYLIRIPEDSPLVGSTVRKSRIGELVGVTVAGIAREGATHLAVLPDEELLPGDRLLVAGDPERIRSLTELRGVELDREIDDKALESDDVGVAEVTIAPRSSCVGRTLAELDFRERYGLQVLAIWREGNPIHAGMAERRLHFADALLVHGPREKIRRLASDPDFVVLHQAAEIPRRTRKAPWALAGLAVMVGMVVTNFMPIQVAAFTAACVVVLAGAVTMQEAYREIEWRAIFLVAAVLPVGIAMERTGAAQLLANSVTEVAGPLGPYVVLGALIVLSSLLSQGLDGAPAVVLLTPVATQAAESLGLGIYPIMMGISLAASAAFMTPFSHKANLLVMGAGGYRSMDYVKVGTPLTIVLLALMTLLVPVFFPF